MWVRGPWKAIRRLEKSHVIVMQPFIYSVNVCEGQENVWDFCIRNPRNTVRNLNHLGIRRKCMRPLQSGPEEEEGGWIALCAW